MRPCVTQPTCWTHFSTTSLTYASKNTTPTPAGFTDHVFALCHLLGFRFAPRIRDLADKRIYVLEKGSAYPALAGLVGGTLNVRLIATHWNEILRLASSINQGTVTASLILRKLGAYPRQNSLALALGAGSPRADLIHAAMASKP
jgi:TnpA family transposase